MSIILIICAATLVTAPVEALRERRHRKSIKPYRKPDPPKGRKKSPSTYHSNEL